MPCKFFEHVKVGASEIIERNLAGLTTPHQLRPSPERREGRGGCTADFGHSECSRLADNCDLVISDAVRIRQHSRWERWVPRRLVHGNIAMGAERLGRGAGHFHLQRRCLPCVLLHRFLYRKGVVYLPWLRSRIQLRLPRDSVRILASDGHKNCPLFSSAAAFSIMIHSRAHCRMNCCPAMSLPTSATDPFPRRQNLHHHL